MANYVSWYLNFIEISEEATKKLKEIQSRVRTPEEGRYHRWFGDFWVDGEEGSPSYEETEMYDWTLDNIGPKWCYIEEMDENSISGQSAWSPPIEGVEWLLEQLGDENLVCSFSYDDEMPNFFGARVYKGFELISDEEWSYSDLIESVINEYNDELGGKYDHEENEWLDEDSEEIFMQYMYESLANLQDEEIEYGLNYIKEYVE